jgi:glycosyltransferase involved in cell wall biosynthesis
MKWLALTFGGASTLYRVTQYVPLLHDLGIELDCRPSAELDKIKNFTGYDGILLQKRLYSGSRRRCIARSGLPVIFDIDDATWHPLENEHHLLTRWRTQRRLSASLRMARLVLPANEFIAARLRQDQSRVEVVPMTLKLADWPPPAPLADAKAPIVLGWAGAPGNHFQLRSITAALDAVKQASPLTIIRIFSGQRPEMDAEIDFVPFDLEKQSEVLRSFSVGVLPLPDTPFNHGKSPIKALQYMAAGIPCVASPLSGTVEMLGQTNSGALYASSTAEWIEKLTQLIRDAALRREMGTRGRARFEQHYTAEATARTLATRMRELAAPRS